jgi:hypothetical protein
MRTIGLYGLRQTLFAFAVLMAVFGGLLLTGQDASASVPRDYVFHIPVATPEPVFTGSPQDLATPGWKKAYKASAFTNFNTRSADTYGTDAYVAFGKSGIYIALMCPQPTARITATQATNDVGFGLDDYAGVAIDTTGSGELTYFFETTPNGTRYEQSSESSRYRPTWRTATSHDATSWFAELYIPFDVLRRSAAPSQHWRINFVRYVAASQQQLTWAYNPGQASPFSATEWPSVTDIPIDLTIARSHPNAEVYGLADFGHDRTAIEGPAGTIVSQSPRMVGVDAKIPITNLLNFVGTVNPDFSNVESDQQLTTPQEFRRQYAEYRPFFTEGANFLPSSDVLYTPNIGIFNEGEKVEGEVAGASVGVLNVTGDRTDTTAFQVRDMRDNGQFSVTAAGAFNDIPGASDQTLKTSVSYLNEYSKIGVYSDYAIDRGTYVDSARDANSWDIGTSVTRPNYGVTATYSDEGPQYAPINGYVAQNDVHGFSLSGSLSSTESPTSPIRTASISADGDRFFDDSGAVRLADDFLYGQLLFRNTLQISAATIDSQLRSYAVAYPQYAGGTTAPYDSSFISVGVLQNTPRAAYVSLTWGHFANYYLQQTLGSASSPVTKRISVTLDFDQSLERFDDGAPTNGQILKRLSLFDSISPNDSATLSYRIVSGSGGSAVPGSNLAIGYTKRTAHGNQLIIEIGSPAAPVTQERFIIKYVQLIGGGVGL